MPGCLCAASPTGSSRHACFLRAPIPRWQPSRLNTRYQPALRLAELVLRATSIEYDDGPIVANGLLLDMPAVFQGFLTTALRETLVAHYGGRVVQEPPIALDVARRVTMKPDIVWRYGGRDTAVIDAKYKWEGGTGDLYQMLAYCTALRLRRGYLVYAASELGATATVHVVRNAGVDIICHALDLAVPPAEVLAQVRGLAAHLVGTAAEQVPLSDEHGVSGATSTG